MKLSYRILSPLLVSLLLLAACAKPQSAVPSISQAERQREIAAQQAAVRAAQGQETYENFQPSKAQLAAMQSRLSQLITRLRPEAIRMCQQMTRRHTNCEVNIQLSPEAQGINAFADGKRIVISPAIMEFTKSEPEQLAFVILHEYVHHFMGHVDAAKQNVTLGALAGMLGDALANSQGVSTNGQLGQLGATAGRLSYSPNFEQEADYVALYMLKRTGFDISKAPHFWRRMAAINPRGIYNRSTHPTTPERFVGMQKTIDEINRKHAAGLPLLPNRLPNS